MEPNDINSFIELIPQHVKISIIRDLLTDLKSGLPFSPELEKKYKLAVSFLSESMHLTLDDNFYIELIDTSLSYCWLNSKHAVCLSHLLSSFIFVSNRCLENRTIVSGCIQKHLNILSEKCASSLIESKEEDITVCIVVLDCIVDSVIDDLCFKDIQLSLVIISEYILELTLYKSRDILTKFLLIFKKICNSNNSKRINCNLLQTNWELLKKKYQNCSHQDYCGISLYVVCFLADFYIVDIHTLNGYPLQSDNVLWEIIQTGLIDDDPLIRKQSLYLLKRCITALDENSNDVNTSLFHWISLHKKELIEYWNSYFVLWEALEDKQIHLIIPALRLFEKIIEISSKQIVSTNWMCTLFIFCFKNESITVIKKIMLIFFNVDVNLFLCCNNLKTVFYYVFKALNNMQLYGKTASPDESNFRECLGTWFQNIASKNLPESFSTLISVLVEVKLCSVPIFFIINEIKASSWNIKWNSSSLKILKKLVNESSRGQNVKIRGAVQCLILSLLSNHFQQEVVSLEEIAEFFIAFPSSESLKRGTKCWAASTNWITKLITIERVTHFLEKCYHMFSSFEIISCREFISLEALARIIVLLEDASLIAEFEKLKFFYIIFDNFTDCDKRKYINTQMQDVCFEFISHLLIESIPFNRNEKFVSRPLTLINNEFSNLTTFLCLRLKYVSSVDDLKLVDLYLKFIEIVIIHHKLFDQIHQNFVVIHNLAIDILKKDKIPQIQEYFALKIVNLIQKYVLYLDVIEYKMCLMIPKDVCLALLNSKLFKKTLIIEEKLNLPASMKGSGGKMISGSIQSVWSLLYHFLSSGTNLQSILEKNSVEDIFQDGLEALNIGGKENIIYVLKVFELLIPFCKNSSYTIHICEFTWEACFEYRKTELFWRAIEEWISAVYQECILGDINYHKFLINHGHKIITLGHDIFGLVNLFILRLHSLRSVVDLSPFADIIVSCLLFGPLLHKDQRIEKEACDFIEDEGDDLTINILMPEFNGKSNLEVRMIALNILLDTKIINWNNLVRSIGLALIKSYRELTKCKRYFNDSLAHRKRNRILQVLLTLHCLFVNDVYFHVRVIK
ncbi:probable methyltransferase TARBP1 isoform X3 [Rhodnius prolixus]|uniref:probable methyltransferase TARBP1 isoform X3 n=1 Tax=Rhodnius prolixus TaxID=13249 RepID=UPI003D18C9EC